MRVRLDGAVPDADVDALSQVVRGCPTVRDVTVFPRIGSLAVRYDSESRSTVLAYLCRIDGESVSAARAECTVALAPRTHSLLLDIADLVGGYYLRKWFLPYPLRVIWTLWRYRHYLWEALRSLVRSRLDVPVLDASAIGVSLVQRDPLTASETMFLLDFEETLEDYTRARSQNELIYSLLAVPETAQRIRGSEEETVPATELTQGDLIALRTGTPVPIDGTVERGTAMVNQAALTGEPLAVERTVGDDVFAGTAIEEGEIFVGGSNGHPYNTACPMFTYFVNSILDGVPHEDFPTSSVQPTYKDNSTWTFKGGTYNWGDSYYDYNEEETAEDTTDYSEQTYDNSTEEQTYDTSTEETYTDTTDYSEETYTEDTGEAA